MAADVQCSANMGEKNISPSISEFYSEKNVLITGGTGFIGKVLIEKLLRSCPRINRVYLLMRQKKSKDVHQRLEDLVHSPIFVNMRENQPDFQSKLIPIEGDICLPDLGISDSDRRELEESVNIVFHSAATIRFDEPIRCTEYKCIWFRFLCKQENGVAVEMNVLGVRKMVDLCKHFKKLDVFVHVSTAYANCDLPVIKEDVYPSPVEPQKLIDLIDWMDTDVLDSLTPYLIGNKPNTYIYTKQLAEDLLIKEASSLPLAIVRPSIVGAALEEPLPGWIDNLTGLSGIISAYGTGLLRTLICDPRAVADLIPVDMTVNMLVTVGWYTAITKPDKVPVYNCTTGSLNPLTWDRLKNACKISMKKVPLDTCIRKPSLCFTTNRLRHRFNVLAKHVLPAYVMDMGLRLSGKKPRLVTTYNKLHRAMDTLTYFSLRSWEWTYDNQDMLLSHMSPEDRETFYIDPRSVNWLTYMGNYCVGIKTFVLKEDEVLTDSKEANQKIENVHVRSSTEL